MVMVISLVYLGRSGLYRGARSLQELSTLPLVSPWCCSIAHEQRQREDDDRQARRRRPSAATHLSAESSSVWTSREARWIAP